MNPETNVVDALDRPIEPPPITIMVSIRTPTTKFTCSTTGVRFRKRLWLVLGVVALVTMLAVVYVARKPDFYEAQARVRWISKTAVRSSTTHPLYGSTDDPIYFNTQLQILVSPGLMRRVVRTLDLEHNPDFFKGSPSNDNRPGKRCSAWSDSGSKPEDQNPSRPISCHSRRASPRYSA